MREFDKWQKVLDINLTGAFLFSQAAGREMLKREYGRIINVASVSGLQSSGNDPYYVGYANYITGQTMVVNGGRTIV